VLQDRQGFLWFATADGLNRYDGYGFTVYRPEPGDPQSLSSNVVTHLYEDTEGTLWVCTARAGASRSDHQSSTFAVYRHRPDQPNSLSESSIYDVYEDRDSLLWVGTIGGGLNRVDRRNGAVTHYRHDPNDPRSLADDNVPALYEDRAGRFWVGTSGGLQRLDRQTGTFESFPLASPDSAQQQQVLMLGEAPGGTLWVGTRGQGLYRFDPERGVATAHYRISEDSTGVNNNVIFDVEARPDGGLWIGTARRGLMLLDPETGLAEHFRHDPDDPASLSSDFIVALHHSSDGRLWVATYGGGLNVLDPGQPEDGFTRYTAQNSGLPSNTLAGLLEDDGGHLWIGTYAGLAEFNPKAETFRTYGLDRGVQSTEFNLTAYHKSPSGEMFFGGVNGLNAFDPEDVGVNPHPPEVVLTDAAIRARGFTGAGRDSVLHATTDSARARLAHDQNDFSFEYVGLHYAAPERNAYAYRLDGYDDGWQDVGTGRQALYTNLDPGDYAFRVKAANRDGVWSDGRALLAFTIRPPWWDTWWAYGVYALLLGYGLLGGP
jgi:ligand-binding sensor domain-containing protein